MCEKTTLASDSSKLESTKVIFKLNSKGFTYSNVELAVSTQSGNFMKTRACGGGWSELTPKYVYTSEVFMSKPKKDKVQNSFYSLSALFSKGSVLVLTGERVERHRDLLKVIQRSKSKIVIAELIPESQKVIVENLSLFEIKERRRFLVGLGDYLQVLDCAKPYLEDKIALIDLDFCRSLRILIRYCHLFEKIQAIFESGILANKISFIITYCLRDPFLIKKEKCNREIFYQTAFHKLQEIAELKGYACVEQQAVRYRDRAPMESVRLAFKRKQNFFTFTKTL